MFKLLNHKADIGIKGYGNTLEKAFQETAKAMFSIMTNLKKIERKKELRIKVKAKNKEELLIEFLNELLYLSYSKEMLFNYFKLKISKKKKEFELNAVIKGETVEGWNPAIKNPVSVRYGWGNNIICNLYNDAGLPAVPFQAK